MSALADRIAEVLRDHGPVIKWGDDTTYCECAVGRGFEYTTDHAAHVAERIEAELGLTEEERSYYDHAEPYATAYEHRWVSAWSEVPR